MYKPEVRVRRIELARRSVDASPTAADHALIPHAPRAQDDRRPISSLENNFNNINEFKIRNNINYDILIDAKVCERGWLDVLMFVTLLKNDFMNLD